VIIRAASATLVRSGTPEGVMTDDGASLLLCRDQTG
jgi:hypothetical protein